jgi:NAD(P)-dependent dehydrogenase (short-subunit alcohol dehydrogenase family)
MNTNKVWYITGASQGLGLSLVKQLLAGGYRVAATSRSASDLQQAAGVNDPSRLLPLKVDLTSADAIRHSIEQTIATFGTIDVIVNNAGYGMEGTVEELDEKQMRAIKVTVVGPSGFRTGFLTKDSLVSTESQIADYQAVARTRSRYAAMNGKQDGDPEKAAALFIQLAENPAPPLHLWLGANALDRAGEKIESMGQELKKWKDLSVAADFK